MRKYKERKKNHANAKAQICSEEKEDQVADPARRFMTPQWVFIVLPIIASFLAGGVWYFHSQGHLFKALWFGFSAYLVVGLLVALYLRNEIIQGEEGHQPPALSKPEMQDVIADETSPLKFSAYLAPNGNYPSGTTLGGIQWEDSFVDVRLEIRNESDTVAQNIDLSIRLDSHIAGVGQLTNVPEVHIRPDDQPMPAVWLGGTDDSGKPVTVPIVPTGPVVSPVYRVFCPRLLSNDTIRAVIASVALNPAIGGKFPQKLFAPRRKPAWLHVQGVYEKPQMNPPRRFRVNWRVQFDHQ